MCDSGPCAGSSHSAQAASPPLQLADIIRAFRPAYVQQHALGLTERTVLDAIERCRTAALGGHVTVCLSCGAVSPPSYNSCHDRHCPKCPAVAQARWIAGRLQRVLPTHYFHVVFTLPSQLRAVARANPRLVYRLLFQCAAATLLQLGQDPRRLGGTLGVTEVLHTWTQKLDYHPHLHCIVTGGALSADAGQWFATHPDFLFPVRVMGKLFRGKMLDALVRAERRGKLRSAEPARLGRLLTDLYRKNWNVYCKRPFGGPQQVIQYLGQYTHRVAISNQRLVAMDQRTVTFRTKTGEKVTLDGVEFLSRWLCHVLPPGFTKIRHYGLMSASHVTSLLPIARALLLTKAESDAAPPCAPDATPTPSLPAVSWRELIQRLTGIDLGVCPVCGSRAIERRSLPCANFEARAPPRAA